MTNSPKDEGFTAYQKGLSLHDNPYPTNSSSHFLWKQEYINSAVDEDFEPLPEQRNITYYVCCAMIEQGTYSERELSKRLDKAPNFVNSLLAGKSLPSDEIMMKIAIIGKQDVNTALLDLNIWRAPPIIQKAYADILQKITHAALVICALGVFSLNSSPAQAANNMSNTSDDFVYYGKYYIYLFVAM